MTIEQDSIDALVGVGSPEEEPGDAKANHQFTVPMTDTDETVWPPGEMTVAELLEAYAMTAETLLAKLGPMPNPEGRVPATLGKRILAVLSYRTKPMSAAQLVVAVGAKWGRQSIYNAAHKMVARGLIRRPRHGYYTGI